MDRFDLSRRPLSGVTLASLLHLLVPILSAEEPTHPFREAWAISGPCCGDKANDLAVDAEGNYFIVGSFGTLDLDGDGEPEDGIRCDNMGDIFVARYTLGEATP